jgi:hypothetical protein
MFIAKAIAYDAARNRVGEHEVVDNINGGSAELAAQNAIKWVERKTPRWDTIEVTIRKA